MKYYLLFLILFLSGIALYAQEPCSIHLDYAQGLPSTEVFDLLQDSKGYIWMGHNNGLCRYDGYTFKNYSNKDLSGKAISGLTTDREGRIWCLNFTGQICYVENDTLRILTEYEKLNEPNFAIFAIDRQKNILYSSSSKGLFVYDISKRKSELKRPAQNPFFQTRQLLLNQQGDVYFATPDQGLWVYAKGNFVKLNKQGDALEIAVNFYPVPGKSFVFFDKISHRFYAAKNGEVIGLGSSLNTGMLNSFSSIGTTNYMNTSEGSFSMDVRESEVVLTPFSKNRFISDLIRDSEGNYWLSTLNEGVFIVPDPDFKKFNEQNAAIGNKLSTLGKGPGDKLLVGGGDGRIYFFDAKLQEVYEKKELEHSRSINKIYYSKYWNTWFVAANKLYGVNATTGAVTTLHDEFLNVKDMLIYRNTMITANPLGVNIYRLDKQPMDSLIGQLALKSNMQKKMPGLNFNGVANAGLNIGGIARCRSILLDTISQTLWACYASGLKIYTLGGILIPRVDNKPVYATKIMAIGTKKLVGTIQKGLLLYEDTLLIRSINTDNGLLSNAIISVKVENNVVWILTSLGMQRTDTSFSRFENFTLEDELFCNEISDFELNNGKVWITSGDGLLCFPAKASAINLHKPAIFLNYLRVNDAAIDPDNYNELEPHQNNISISFQSFPYKGSNRFRYKYRLRDASGRDTNWIYTDLQNNNLRFFSLSPQNYTFEVLAINEDGIESLRPLQISFRILKPFYLRWWFLLLAVIAGGFGIGIAWYFRMRYVKRKAFVETQQALLEKNLTEARLSAIKAQMKPHFIFNVLNSIKGYIYKNDKEHASAYLSDFSDLMRNVLDMSNRQYVSIVDELNILKLYIELEAMMLPEGFSYQIEVAADVDRNDKIPSLLIQPYVENAFKHGLRHLHGDKSLHIWLYAESETLIIEITDNGIGRKASGEIREQNKVEHQSFATNAIENRILLINREGKQKVCTEIIDMFDELNKPSGTQVVLRIQKV